MDTHEQLQSLDDDFKFYCSDDLPEKKANIEDLEIEVKPVSFAGLNDLDQVLSGDLTTETKIRETLSQRISNRNVGAIYNR